MMTWIRDNVAVIFISLTELITATMTVHEIIAYYENLAKITPSDKWKPLGWFLAFALCVLCSQVVLLLKLRPRLHIVFGPYTACRHGFMTTDGPATLFRIGLINTGGKTIENVQVSLVQISPQGITFGPIKLQFMNQRQLDAVYSLHPGKNPSLFADIIQDVFDGSTSTRVFALPYAVTEVPNILRGDDYCLTILAEGQDVHSVQKEFLISRNNGQLTFREGCNRLN